MIFLTHYPVCIIDVSDVSLKLKSKDKFIKKKCKTRKNYILYSLLLFKMYIQLKSNVNFNIQSIVGKLNYIYIHKSATKFCKSQLPIYRFREKWFQSHSCLHVLQSSLLGVIHLGLSWPLIGICFVGTAARLNSVFISSLGSPCFAKFCYFPIFHFLRGFNKNVQIQ